MEYYKISDILFHFNENVILKFSSLLSTLNKNNEIKYLHNEYEFTMNKGNNSEVFKTIIRTPSYYLSIENKANKKEFLKINNFDLFQLRTGLLSFTNSGKDDLYIQMNNMEFIKIYKAETTDNICIECNNMQTIYITNSKLLELVSILVEINMLNLWNHHMTYASNTSNRYLGLSTTVIENTNNSYVDTKSKKIVKGAKERKKSFFDL